MHHYLIKTEKDDKICTSHHIFHHSMTTSASKANVSPFSISTIMFTDDTSTLEERKHILKTDIMPVVLDMQRFLGKLNYGDQFYHHQKKGQLSWEFQDRDTKTTFKPTLLGEIASPTYSTLLNGKGNFKPPRNAPVNISVVSL